MRFVDKCTTQPVFNIDEKKKVLTFLWSIDEKLLFLFNSNCEEQWLFYISVGEAGADWKAIGDMIKAVAFRGDLEKKI